MSDRKIELVDRAIAHSMFFRLDVCRLRHSRFDGSMTPVLAREVLIPSRGAAAVLPYDPVTDDVVLIEQFRVGAYVAGEPAWTIETVGGLLDDGESAEDVARRETLEEAGLVVHDLRQIARFMPTPGTSSETITLFLGVVDASAAGGVHGLADEGEDIRVHRVSFSEACDWLDAGRITTAYAIIALQWLRLNREALRRDHGQLP